MGARALAVAAFAALAACGPKEKTPAAPPALPDWSGWWKLVSGPAERLDFAQGKFSEYLVPAARERLQAMVAGVDFSAPGSYCEPARFVGFNGGARDAVEFLLTPARVTIDNESGLLRRVFTDGRALPADPEESNAGTSVGHWDGQTLVVRTVGVHASARFPGPASGNPTIGDGAVFDERMATNAAGQLEIELIMTAPGLLTRPMTVTRVYAREKDHVLLDHDMCSAHDRSIDPQTGKQRFDMTPPSDLAPPPPLPQ